MRRLTYLIGTCCTFIFATSFAADTMNGTTGPKDQKGASGMSWKGETGMTGPKGAVAMHGATGKTDPKGVTGPKGKAIGMNDQKATDEDVIDDTDVYAIPLDKSADSDEADMAKLKQMQKQEQEKTAKMQQQQQK
jgi:hypothetical protein